MKEKAAQLSGKTGSGFDGTGGSGWFAGYLECADNVYYFATNIEGDDRATGAAAKKISLEILKNKNLL